ncbi:iron-sulfur cluster repair protein YtfE [Sediminicurvatus halobius]|uniref:Iron-sulfur cluster repair di-iron protein n=1 Tax=Sediminicurvatus halobius TaxID=2182432 RepID=A0A2U2MX00_9GAMM|nr:iron-sulfur cluster repair protein YtfE [Spiribacter halobius]PWG61380.1 iron-sulfur cluster repair di-iron protein [Spiribacter halobius]UEX76593.1 iron-sulfur cluster repair protein YtfE [Spiribacter halobius]
MNIQAASDHFGERTVGEIAASLPGATAVFRDYRLDFCCGGDVPLRDAAARRGIATSEIAERLAALGQSDALAYPQETSALIDHILVRYHQTHRRELPELIRLARKVESVHRDHAAAPRGLADELELMSTELDAHMQKEEEVLFPMMRRVDEGQPLGPPVAVMRAEHDDHGTHLHRLDAITDGFRVPEGACRSWQALYAGTAKLVDDVMAHVHLENHVLFPRFE